MKMSREVVVWFIALTKKKKANRGRHRFVPDLSDTNEKTNYPFENISHENTLA